MKKRIFDIIQIGDKSNIASRAFDFTLVLIILLNIITMFLETFDQLGAYIAIFRAVEYVTTLFFCVEYVLRVWTADLLYPDAGATRARLRFLVSFDGIIDLLTIIPVFFLTGFIVFRMLRVVRIFHLFRLNAQYDSFNVITTVLYEKRNQIVSSVFIIVILMLASSLCMYSAEHDAQPEVFANAFSGIWWAVSTILTVGYGDIYPVTILGKCMAVVIAFLGVGVVAIPTGIISAGFVEQYTRTQDITDYKKLDIAEIVELLVDERVHGRTIEEVRRSDKLKIYLVLRDDMSLLPDDGMRLRKGDIVVGRVLE
jgi:voltage-gated potassium channel